MTVPNIARQFGLPYQSLREWMISNGVEYKKDIAGASLAALPFDGHKRGTIYR